MDEKTAVVCDTKTNIHWDETTEVIIVGSGFAGLSAAIEARSAGAAVIVLEKMKAVGGNSTISDGGIAAPGTDIQKQHGIEDSEALMYADMMRAGLGINDPALVKVVTDHAREAFEWSRDVLGVTYLNRLDQFGGHSVPRCYAAKNISGSTIIQRQVMMAQEIGVEIQLNTRCEAFIQDDTGRVIGVKATGNADHRHPEAGIVRHIKIEKGIVLATGGFAADIPFRMIQDPRLTAEVDTTNKPFATAEMLKAALRIGAAPVQLSHIQLGPWASPDEKGYGVGPLFADYILFQYGIILDPATGERFVNELSDRKTLADCILAVGHPCLGIADAAAVQSSGWHIEKCLKNGIVKEFDSLHDYAAYYHVPWHKLENTVQSFNSGVVARRDPLFSKPIIEEARPIGQPPFYGIQLWPKVHYTMGGLRINPAAAVVDLEGEVIQGLYAAGEITGGIHGACRLGSCSITECLVFGRIAGRSAANAQRNQESKE